MRFMFYLSQAGQSNLDGFSLCNCLYHLERGTMSFASFCFPKKLSCCKASCGHFFWVVLKVFLSNRYWNNTGCSFAGVSWRSSFVQIINLPPPEIIFRGSNVESFQRVLIQHYIVTIFVLHEFQEFLRRQRSFLVPDTSSYFFC